MFSMEKSYKSSLECKLYRVLIVILWSLLYNGSLTVCHYTHSWNVDLLDLLEIVCCRIMSLLKQYPVSVYIIQCPVLVVITEKLLVNVIMLWVISTVNWIFNIMSEQDEIKIHNLKELLHIRDGHIQYDILNQGEVFT